MEIEWDGAEIEMACNSFSAEFLVPLDDFKKECKRFSTFNGNTITELGKIYGVSERIIILRLLHAGVIDKKVYAEFKRESKEKAGRKTRQRNWEKIFWNRDGGLAIRKISEAYHSGEISYSEVIDVLNMKTKYIEKFI